MTASVTESLQLMERLTDQLIRIAPRAAMVLVVLVVGIVLSLLARSLTRWGVRRSGLEGAAEGVGAARLLHGIGYKRSLADLLGQVVWIAGLLCTFAASAEVVGLSAVTAGTAVLVGFLPRLLAGVGVLVGGLLLAGFLETVLLRFGRKRDDVESPRFVALLVYYAIVVVAVTMGVQQVGLDTKLINAMLKIVLGGAALSLAAAFALGSRQAFQNLIARYYYERLVRPGDRVKIGDSQGLLVRYSPLAAVIRIDGGERIIPCRLLLEQPVDVEHVFPAAPQGTGDPPGATQ